jgi:hypothetical protein
MLVFDVFYYSTYCFCRKILKRRKYDAKESSLAHLIVYISFCLFLQITSIWGLLTDNDFIRWLITDRIRFFIAAVIIGIITVIIFGIRYYKIYDIEDIERKILNLPKTKRKFYRYLNLFIMISFPIGTFCLYRLYVHGHIQWW